ncbi:MAG TPA: class I SAM-dependent methyltransferase [Candidatus Methylomirabilis sp.]|nr:class I SAM-dependent methyltransferase [Candidatus Methylomirabilis sp.]
MSPVVACNDKWAAGDAYEAYMGRWSRPVARPFVEWLRPKPSAHWLDVGCGTGALTSTICQLSNPASVIACDPSESFVNDARSRILDPRVSFLLAGAHDLPMRDGGFNAVVSGLVLNFVSDPEKAVASMRACLCPGGCVAAYVWDYAGRMEFLRHFWEEAIALDRGAASLDEGRRFPLCQPETLASLFRAARLKQVETHALEISTYFEDFNDYWKPFLGGTGPAPTYAASLEPSRRELLRQRLQQRLQPEPDGQIHLVARAWAVRGFSS